MFLRSGDFNNNKPQALSILANELHVDNDDVIHELPTLISTYPEARSTMHFGAMQCTGILFSILPKWQCQYQRGKVVLYISDSM
jgi:hypothetical protein